MNIKLLKDLNFAEKINSTNAITEAGAEMLNNYRGYAYVNPVNCSLVNSFIAEAQKFSFDSGLNAILESVLSFVNENKISWKLASVCESILNNNSSYGYIAKLGVAQVEKLLEMNEAEVVSYIKAGSLKNIQYIPEFRAICKEVYKSTINEVRNTNYTVTVPISYVYVNESGDKFVSVLGKTFKITESKVEDATCDNATFKEINALLESFSKEEDGIFYEYKGIHGDTARFTITNDSDSSKLTFNKGNMNESFENAGDFMSFCNTMSKTMSIQEAMNFMKVSNAIAKVFEAMDSVVVLDCVKLMNCANGTVCAIVEGRDNVNLTVFRSLNAGTSSNNYDYMVEALQQVTKLTGIDLKTMYESRIDEDAKKKDPEEYKQIKEQLEADKAAQFKARRDKIAMLAEQYKNDPVKISLLNKAAKELAMLEDMK